MTVEFTFNRKTREALHAFRKALEAILEESRYRKLSPPKAEPSNGYHGTVGWVETQVQLLVDDITYRNHSQMGRVLVAAKFDELTRIARVDLRYESSGSPIGTDLELLVALGYIHPTWLHFHSACVQRLSKYFPERMT